MSFDAQDLETIVDAMPLDRFALLGISGGAATANANTNSTQDRVLAEIGHSLFESRPQ